MSQECIPSFSSELVKIEVLVAKLEDLPHIEDNFLPLELFKTLPTLVWGWFFLTSTFPIYLIAK